MRDYIFGSQERAQTEAKETTFRDTIERRAQVPSCWISCCWFCCRGDLSCLRCSSSPLSLTVSGGECVSRRGQETAARKAAEGAATFPQPWLPNILPRHSDPKQNVKLMCTERLLETETQWNGIKRASQTMGHTRNHRPLYCRRPTATELARSRVLHQMAGEWPCPLSKVLFECRKTQCK